MSASVPYGELWPVMDRMVMLGKRAAQTSREADGSVLLPVKQTLKRGDSFVECEASGQLCLFSLVIIFFISICPSFVFPF